MSIKNQKFSRRSWPLRVIKDKEIVDDSWTLYDESALESGLPEADAIVPYTYWKDHRDELSSREGAKLGIVVGGEDDIEEIAAEAEGFELIAIDFPAFKDGRGYSQARILRDHYHYKGDIRAVGDVLRDQLYFMHRCGISSFLVKEDKDLEDALHGFSDFSVKYQTAADAAPPIYRQR